MQQPRARCFHIVAQFAEVEAVGGEGVDDAEGVTEVVVEEGPDHALRQRATHVADVLAHLVPDVGHGRRWRRALQVNEYRRLAGDRVAAHAVEILSFLQRALQPLGHLLERLVRRGARPAGRNDHRAHGEGRVLAAAQTRERQRARDHRKDHQEDDQRALAQCPFRKVRADHDCGVSSWRTFCPGRRACTPAVTTTSPGFRPDATCTVVAFEPATVMLRAATVPALGS